MARPDLHLFVEDLKKKPGRGDFGPPRTIKALDLDENYQKVTLLEGEGQPKLYEVEYTKEGTRITKLFADGSNSGDLLYWNGSRWVVLAAPQNNTLRVLTIQSGVLSWTETEGCDDEE